MRRNHLSIRLLILLLIPLCAFSQQAVQTNTQEANTPALNTFDPILGPTAKNPSQVQLQLTERTKIFVESLRVCKPGTYEYDLPGGMGLGNLTTTIQGQVNGLCQTETLYQLGTLGSAVVKCQFTMQQLQSLNPNSLSRDQMNALSNFSPYSPPIGVITKNCQVETTGMLKQMQDYQKSQNQQED